MDVTCDRCKTRYEFDPALVSDRGTTVKCTNCGNQFRVFRPEGSGVFEGWTIRTIDGRELRFTAMRELQAAISNGDVTVEDVLIPSGGGEPKRLGRIEELSSFFAAGQAEHPTIRRDAKRGNTQPPRFDDDVSLMKTNVAGSGTPDDLASSPGMKLDAAGAAMPSRSGTTLRPPAKLPEPEPMAERRIPPRFPATPEDRPSNARTRVHERNVPEPPTLKGSFEPRAAPPARAAAPEAAPSASTHEAVEALHRAVNDMLEGEAPSSLRELADDAGRQTQREARDEPRIADEDTIGEPDEAPARGRSGTHREPLLDEPLLQESLGDGIDRPSEHPSERPASSSLPPLTPTPSVIRPSILRRSEFTDPRFSTFSPRGKRPSMARWLIGLIGLGVLVLAGFTLFKRYMLPAAPSQAASASASDERVTQLVEQGQDKLLAGDIEGAKEQYVKASGITEEDPRIAEGLARIEVVRADLLWLEMRLLGEDAANRSSVALELAKAIERAERAAEHVDKLAPERHASLAIDILRLKGKGQEARKLVKELNGHAEEEGRVLAALDLIESAPNYGAVIDRLRTAVRAERKLGRAHAMLVYALARAGKKADAAAELAALRSNSPAHPLLAPLKHYVDQAQEDEGDALDASTESASAADPDAPPTDFRDALRRAHQAKKAGDLDRAERLYQAALDKSPGNSEALAGLADVARDRGDSASAAKRYREMLAKNPGYVPALIGLADIQWASGQRAEALALYRQVVQSAPGSAYAKHAQARIDAAKGAPQPTEPKPTAEPKPTTEPTPEPRPDPSPPPPSGSAAPVDTTDLPAPPPPSGEQIPDGVDVSDLPEYH